MIDFRRFVFQCAGPVLAGSLTCANPAFANSSAPLLRDSESSFASACLDYQHDHERMIEICKQALAQSQGASPRQIASMNRTLGDAFQAIGEFEKAREQFETILQADPSSVSGLIGMGWLIFETEDPPIEAKTYFERALSISASADAVAGFASASYALQDITLEEFLQGMDTALAIRPDYDWVMREKGWKLYYADRNAEAAEAFSQALDLNPADINALAGRSQALQDLDPSAALIDINRGLQEDPDDPWWYGQRSAVQFNMNNFRRALADAERFIEKRPKIASGYVRKARAMAALGQRAAALQLLDEVRSTEELQRLNFLRYWQALLLSDEGEWQKAREVLQENLDSGDPDRYDRRIMAHILIELGHPDEALNLVDEALRDAPNWAMLHYYRAWARVEKRQPELALTAFDTVRELGLEDWMAEDFTSALVSQGYYVEAIQLRLDMRDD